MGIYRKTWQAYRSYEVDAIFTEGKLRANKQQFYEIREEIDMQ